MVPWDFCLGNFGVYRKRLLFDRETCRHHWTGNEPGWTPILPRTIHRKSTADQLHYAGRWMNSFLRTRLDPFTKSLMENAGAATTIQFQTPLRPPPGPSKHHRIVIWLACAWLVVVPVVTTSAAKTCHRSSPSMATP